MIQMSKGQKAKGQQGLPLWYFVNIFSIFVHFESKCKTKAKVKAEKRKSGKAEKRKSGKDQKENFNVKRSKGRAEK